MSFGHNVGGLMKSFNSGVSRLSTEVAKRLRGSPRVTPERDNVSSIERVEDILRERAREMEAQAQRDTPV